MLLFDIAVGVILLLAIVAIEKSRCRIIAVSRRGYFSMVSGMLLIFITAAIRVTSELNVSTPLSVFSESIVYDLVCAIVAIAGITLLVGGATRIIATITRRLYTERNSSTHLGVVRKVEQLTNVEHRLDRLLVFALDTFVTDCALDGGEVVKISPRSGISRLVGAVGTPAPVRSEAARSVDPDSSVGRVEIPIIVHGINVARMSFWGPDDLTAGSSMAQSMRAVAGIIAQKIKRDELQLRLQFHTEKELIRNNLERELSGHLEPQAAITALGGALRTHLGGELVTVLWFQPEKRQMSRFTSSDSGLLTEHGLAMAEESSIGGWILAHGSPVLITDALDSTMTALDISLAAAGIQSVVAVPLTADHRSIGALILGSTAPAMYTQRHLQFATDCASSATRLLQVLESEKRIERQERTLEKRLRRISAPLHAFATSEYFEDTANLIGREFGWDMVRISVTDSHDTFLQSLAFAGRDIGTAIVPADGTLVLAIMNRHARVMKTGIPLKLFAEGDKANVSRLELDHILGQSCLSAEIRPIASGNKIVGLLTLGRMGAVGGELSSVDDAFLALIEANLALAIESRNTILNPAMSASISRVVTANRSERDLRNRLRSSLTGILGSLELIKSETGDLRHDRAKYLEIIDKSARRMQQYLETPEKVR